MRSISRLMAALLIVALTSRSAVTDSTMIADFETWKDWIANHAAKSTIVTEGVKGRTGGAIRIRYDVTNDHWVEIGHKMTFDWRKADAFHFYLRGDANGSVLELKLKDGDGSYYGLKLPISGLTPDQWTLVSVPFRDCHYLWGGDSSLDTVESVWFAVSRGLKRAGFVDIDDFSYSARIPGEPVARIHASQIGYHPWDEKTFVVRVFDAPAKESLTGTFRVVPLAGGKAVYEGSLDPRPYPKWEGQFLTGDFSAVRADGSYRIEVSVRAGGKSPAAAQSYPFAVAANVLSRITAPIQYAYARFMRCGIICHKDDPVPGGYHDTQMDISKRMWSLPHFLMGLARYAATGAFRFDHDTDGVDDAAGELRFGLNYMATAPEPDGTVSWGGIEADFKKFMSYEDFIARLGPLRPAEDTIPRIKYLDKNFHGTCFNAVALLEAAPLVRPADPALADLAEKVALRAWDWIDVQPMKEAHDYGVYLYAASTFHRRFKDARYLRRIDAALKDLLDLQSLDPALIENGAVGNFFFSPAERDFHFQYKFASFNVAIHLALIQLEQDLPRSHPLWNRIHYANAVFAKSYLPAMSGLTPYGQIAHGLEPGPAGKFHPRQFAGKAGERAAASFHGLNCDHFAYAYAAMRYAQITGDSALERFADDQIQWALGKNPLGYSMMAGAGSSNPAFMSAYFGKGPVTGEIANGIVSSDDPNEEPQWWGEGPSSGEDWLPHNSYYLSLIAELDRPSALVVRVRNGAAPVKGTITVEREDGKIMATHELTAGAAGPIELTPQARHTVRIAAKPAGASKPMTRVSYVTPVSGQSVSIDVDLARDIDMAWTVPAGAETERDAAIVLSIFNRSASPVEARPSVSIVGGSAISPLPERITVLANGRMDQKFRVRADGGRPVLVRVEDRDNANISADAFWIPRVAADIAVPEADDLSSIGAWKTEQDQGATVKVSADDGAIRADYNFGSGKWVQSKKDISMDLQKFGAIKFRFKSAGPANRLEVKLVDAAGGTIGRAMDGATATADWRAQSIPFADFQFWWGGTGTFDWSKVRAIFFAVSRATGGSGSVWIDDIAFDRAPRVVKEAPAAQKAFEYVKGNADIARKAARWISSMQKKSGLILSYEGDHKPFAWTYDQGICLIALARENRPAAERLLNALQKLQKPEGYWNDGYMIDLGEPVELSEGDRTKWFKSAVPGVIYEYDNRWVGSAAWVVYGIQRYMEITGDRRWESMMMRGAKWLASQQKPDGRLHDVTEGNMTSWRAMNDAGLKAEADKLKAYLMTKVWNDEEGRFLVSTDNTQIYLDVQTWGADFAVGAGDPARALRSLAFARKHLACRTFDRLTRGLDATGPYTVWNEGTLQYIVAGGEGAAEYLADMNKQQRADGAIQHSHEEYEKGGAWHTVMYGVCPAAWLYFANKGDEPFPKK